MRKKWFNKICKVKRKEFRRARNRYRSCKSMVNLDVMKNTCKSYKVAIKNATKKFQKKFNKKLRILRSSNPKEYWSLLCTNGGKEKLNKIQLDVLAKYFADLNQDKNEYDDSDYARTEIQDEYENQFLNAPFTEADILDVLCKLKCGKAAGPDGLINDFFKYSRNVIAKVLSKLFSVILLSGSVPKEWADGWIVPIYIKKRQST